MLNLDIVVKQIDKFDSKRIKQEKEDELSALFRKAMSFSSTSEIDFDIFTPELILRLAAYGAENATAQCEAIGKIQSFIKACCHSPHVMRKHYGCM